MENLLLKAIMVSIFMWITFFDKYVTQFFTYRPIVVGAENEIVREKYLGKDFVLRKKDF